MKRIIIAFRMALGMFTSIPLPHGEWREELRKDSVLCLPAVGLVIGGLWLLIAYLAKLIFSAFLAAAFIAAAPLVLTGFMHLDGYMDTSDAILSWRDREERVRILKDVHCGSFAVVMLGLLLMFQYGACASLNRIFPLLLIPALSRCGSAFSVLNLRPLGHSEYAPGSTDVVKPPMLPLIVSAAAAVIVLLIVCGWKGLLIGFGTLAGYAVAMYTSIHSLGGVSGDLAGFSLTIAELCGLILTAAL